MVRGLLERRPVRGLFYPRDDAPEVRQLSGWLRQEVIPCVLLSHKTDRAVIQIEPHISVQAFMTAHLGQEYRDVPHACYLLTFDGRRVLFTADTDYLYETLSHLSGTHLDAVFLNPLFYQACFNRRLFRGYFDTDTLCVYHVPFREDDPDAHAGYGAADAAGCTGGGPSGPAADRAHAADRNLIQGRSEPMKDILEMAQGQLTRVIAVRLRRARTCWRG